MEERSSREDAQREEQDLLINLALVASETIKHVAFPSRTDRDSHAGEKRYACFHLRDFLFAVFFARCKNHPFLFFCAVLFCNEAEETKEFRSLYLLANSWAKGG